MLLDSILASLKRLDNFYEKSIPTEDLVKKAEFVLKNNSSEFNSNVKPQVFGTATGTKFAAPYACICFRYIDDIFFISTASEKELDDFLERLINFHPNLKFTDERSREEINFLDVTVRVNHGEFITDLYCKSTDGHQYLHFVSHVTLVTQNLQLFLVKL